MWKHGGKCSGIRAAKVFTDIFTPILNLPTDSSLSAEIKVFFFGSRFSCPFDNHCERAAESKELIQKDFEGVQNRDVG